MTQATPGSFNDECYLSIQKLNMSPGTVNFNQGCNFLIFLFTDLIKIASSARRACLAVLIVTDLKDV